MSPLLTPEALLRQGLSPAAKILDLKGRLRCRGCGRKGRAVVSIKWRERGACLRLLASEGILSRQNVNSSAVSGGNTVRGAARVSERSDMQITCARTGSR